MAWYKTQNVVQFKTNSVIISMAWYKTENGTINGYQQDYKYGFM